MARIHGIMAETDTLGKRTPCRFCGKYVHRLDAHLLAVHQCTPAFYLRKFPGSSMMSEGYIATINAIRGIPAPVVAPPAITTPVKPPEPVVVAPAFVLDDKYVTLQFNKLEIRTDIHDKDRPFIPMKDAGWNTTDETKRQWSAIGLAIQEAEPALMVGPTGCGKSAGFLELAACLNQPVRRVNLHGDVRAADFLGEKVVDVDPETKQSVIRWRDGILPQAIRHGQWLLLDELDAAPPQILFVLQGLLEKNGRLVLTGNDGEVIEPHPNFRVVATANTLGRGDESGLYAGTNVLNEAFLDRFGVVVECDYPTAEQEIQILLKKNPAISKDNAHHMVDIANKVREAFKKDECSVTFSTRRLLSWARKTVLMGGNPKKAARIAVLNKMTGDDRKFVSDLIQRCWGGTID